MLSHRTSPPFVPSIKQLFQGSVFIGWALMIGCSNSSRQAANSSGGVATVSPSSLTFTASDSGYATVAQQVTITNQGSNVLKVSGASLSGADGAYFSVLGGSAGPCTGIPVNSNGGLCTLKVVFTPVAARAYSATLSFTDNATNTPQTVTLSGSLVPGTPVPAVAKFGYVATNSGMIDSFSISSSGAWAPTSPASVSVGEAIGAMAIAPNGKFLFAVGHSSGNLISYSIDPSSGLLTQTGVQAAAAPNLSPSQLAIEANSTFLYTSNASNGTVSTYFINQATGALSPGISIPLPLAAGVTASGANPRALTEDPAGMFVYVSESGYIAAFNLDPTTGFLARTMSPTVAGNPCDALRVDITGKYLYCLVTGSGITTYQIDQHSGTLTAATPAGGPTITGKGSTDIQFTFNGTNAYVTNSTDGTLSMYTESGTTGGLTPLTNATYAIGNGPDAMAIDPGDGFAYVALNNQGVETLSINGDGTLSNLSNVAVSGGPSAIAIYPSHP